MMNIKFYFDYSDHRSYLMLHALRVLEDLPVTVQWIAVDSYSLRALSGYNPHDVSTNAREYLRREALRFCEREHIDFIWQGDHIHSGSALRAGIWMMIHRPGEFDAYSRKVLDAFWHHGKNLDAAMVRTILADQGIDVDEILRNMSESENFQYQDTCLQEALSEGVFDVPAVVIGKEMICHYDQANEIRRLALTELLRSLDSETICKVFARHLMTMEGEGFRKILSALHNKSEIRELPKPQHPAMVQIQHTLARPEAIWHVSRHSVMDSLMCHACPVTDSSDRLLSSFRNAVVGSINICTEFGVEFRDEKPFADFSRANPGSRLFYAAARTKQGTSLLCLEVDDDGGLQFTWADQEPPVGMGFQNLNGWTVAPMPRSMTGDLNMVRYAAHCGAHIIIRIADLEGPYGEASGCLASSWIVDIGKRHVSVIDSASHRINLLSSGDVSLDGTFVSTLGDPWLPPTPRTLLLCEQPLSMGEIGTEADIELGGRNMNLFVSAGQLSSELSSTRVFEKIRVGETSLLLMPVNGEQIFVTELLSHRLIEAYNMAHRDARPLMINYWPELEFEMLEVIRPVLSVTSSMFHFPIILVVGGRIVEIWLSGNQGSAYCIEKDGDCYTIDVDGLLPLEECFGTMVSSLNLTDEGFVARLYDIENADHK